ncbi:RING finger protein vilya [Drosophila eugracilis]|uniref:RING finger protein vilya n=1 Tax=Drosophila eugracilis TaxID=29029 RepID=UPI0007E7A434|nr:RING finger protein vilya [Drosophila eugracilis]
MALQFGMSKSKMAIGEPEASKLWIHCNSCCDLFAEKKSVFFLLACHHVFCKRCVKAAVGHTPSDAPIFDCPICRRSVRGRQVGNTMPNHIKQFFHPEPYALSNDFIETFQRGNHRHFDKYKEKKELEMDKLNKDIEVAKSVCQKRFMEAQMLRVERKKLSQRSQHIKLQVSNQQAEMKRIIQAKVNRSLEPSSTQESSIRGRNRVRGPSQSRGSSKDSSRSPLAKRNQVTSFMHQPNHSFNL